MRESITNTRVECRLHTTALTNVKPAPNHGAAGCRSQVTHRALASHVRPTFASERAHTAKIATITTHPLTTTTNVCILCDGVRERWRVAGPCVRANLTRCRCQPDRERSASTCLTRTVPTFPAASRAIWPVAHPPSGPRTTTTITRPSA